MYKWNIMFILKSGKTIEGHYEGPEKSSDDLALKIIQGNPGDYFGLFGKNDHHNLLVNCDEIAALDIWFC